MDQMVLGTRLYGGPALQPLRERMGLLCAGAACPVCCTAALPARYTAFLRV